MEKDTVYTRVKSPGGKEVLLGDDLRTVLIGERINPFGKGTLREALKCGDMEPIRHEARKQVENGADILIISVAAFGIDEIVILPQVTRAVLEAVDVPVCLESRNPQALSKTLDLGLGKPLISSVTAEKALLQNVLPLVKKYRTCLVAMATGGAAIPREPIKRLSFAREIIGVAEELGISRDDILVDCLAESNALNEKAALTTLETMERVKEVLKVNLILGASNVSFGLPLRKMINAVFLSLAIRAGLNCVIVNAGIMRPYIMAADLLMGKDLKARRFTDFGRKMKSAGGL